MCCTGYFGTVSNISHVVGFIALQDVYAAVLTQEMELVQPAVVVCLGRSAERMCKRIGFPHVLSLPHLTGTARGAMVKRFPRLDELGATVEHIAEVYAQEIMNCMMNQ